MRTVALLMAAGRGARAGGGLAKQFRTLAGKPVIAWAYEALAGHPAIDEVIVVTGDEAAAREALAPLSCPPRHPGLDPASTVATATRDEVPAPRWPPAQGPGDRAGQRPTIVEGGETRRESVRLGLEHIAADAPMRVLIHDAARPFLPADVITRLLASLDAYEGAIPALPVADTLVRFEDGAIGDNVSRTGLYRVQTPQAFVYDAVLNAHRAWPGDEDATDDAQMVSRTGHEVTVVLGDAMLEKITHPQDFAAAEARLEAATETRMATGFDVHRLEAGEELWLGGVLIPHDKGLSGHSDADVALHALTDALLGTIAEGDIGTHFPPSDPQWRGAASDRFLRHAADLIEARGGAIAFVDLTIICEAPKIGPHRPAIRTRVAEILRLSIERVSIKATTTERLGFTGRGEGIAAQAAATVRLPRGA